MAGTKAFISSTCYDLSILRAELRNFVLSLGHEPVMSEYADVLYDPRIHTHTSCVNEVSNCDMMVVIIGSRFGGTSVPQALDQVDLYRLQDASKDPSFITDGKPISITQLEVLKAIENNIPIYTFVEKKLYYEHEIYEKNKDKPAVIKDLVFPAIDKPETAPYIFGFLNYIRRRKSGNQFFQFERLQDIEDVLKKQWSGYFQRLLFEQRNREEENKRIDRLNEQFEDLKTAIITSIENVDQREVANGIVRYRRLAEFLFGIRCEQGFIRSFNGNFDGILNHQDIVDVRDFDELCAVDRQRMIYPRTLFILKDGTFFETKVMRTVIYDLANEWESFKNVTDKSKDYILDALREMIRPSMLVRYHSEHIEDYCHRIAQRNAGDGE